MFILDFDWVSGTVGCVVSQEIVRRSVKWFIYFKKKVCVYSYFLDWTNRWGASLSKCENLSSRAEIRRSTVRKKDFFQETRLRIRRFRSWWWPQKHQVTALTVLRKVLVKRLALCDFKNSAEMNLEPTDRKHCFQNGHASFLPSSGHENNIAQPKTDKCLSCPSHFSLFFTVWLLSVVL